jgi:hypothetical protein
MGDAISYYERRRTAPADEPFIRFSETHGG